MYTKLIPKTAHYIQFHIKIYLRSFVSIYHLYHLFGIITKVFFTTQISYFRLTLSENTP